MPNTTTHTSAGYHASRVRESLALTQRRFEELERRARAQWEVLPLQLRAAFQRLVRRVRTALDVPSRETVVELTTRLEELDRKLQALEAARRELQGKSAASASAASAKVAASQPKADAVQTQVIQVEPLTSETTKPAASNSSAMKSEAVQTEAAEAKATPTGNGAASESKKAKAANRSRKAKSRSKKN